MSSACVEIVTGSPGSSIGLRGCPRRSQVTTVKPSSSGAIPLKTSASPSPGDSRSSVGPWPDTW